ncbi:MAG: TetR/AcrR family transcriptional regulator [Actinomycetia bacterium]|nr:TetR/AcrR family transcriptional regulator [Actinomycetes bacterium]MCH9700619.1 TetR/AcrR family transcriptional regulator [Actinomycetes bacterium]MCH9736541.1 TetR/AcrR family transcriptional regulator [Actinomycetes bacterium]
MGSMGRWAGLSPDDRRAGRRKLLVDAAYELIGRGDDAELSVRSVCREAGLHHRYFYESFPDTDELLGAVYDEIYPQLRRTLTAATVGLLDDRARLRAGIRAVLDFSAADPRHGQILFSAAAANPVLAARRSAAQKELREYILAVRRQGNPRFDRIAAEVAAAIYAGATTQLNDQWLAGSLGSDLDAVIEHAVNLMTPDHHDAKPTRTRSRKQAGRSSTR